MRHNITNMGRLLIMAHEIKWTIDIYNEFCERAMLSDFEKELMYKHIRKESITKIAQDLHVSERTIDRAIQRLKDKYDNAQIGSKCMPERVKVSHLKPLTKLSKI